MKLIRKTLIAAALPAALGLGVSGNAQALTLYYDAFGGFEVPDAVNPPGGVVYGGYNDPDGSFGQVAWGTPTGTGGVYDGKSYLEMNSNDFFKYAPGDLPTPEARLEVETDGGIRTLGDVGHINYPITLAGGSLTGVTIDYHLDIYDSAFGGTRIEQITFHPGFFLTVWETLNEEPCPNNAPAGTVVTDPSNGNAFVSDGNPSGTACDDAHAFGPQSSTPFTEFDYLGETYGVFVSGFYDLPAENPNAQLLGTHWSGPESAGASHLMYAAFEINQIPEPATLGLLGIGLAWMGFTGRRRKQGR